jgi:hypothetical protein
VLAILLLEGGLAARHKGVISTALAIPIALIVLSLLGHRDERVYVEFLAMFTRRLGAGPVFYTLLLASAFYGYTAMRRIAFGLEAATVTLALLSCIRPAAIDLQWYNLVMPHPAPWIAASTILLGIGIWRKQSWRCLAGAMGLAFGVALVLPIDDEYARYRWIALFHHTVLALLVLGAAFNDALARALRFLGSFLALLACLSVLLMPSTPSATVPTWMLQLYPLAIALLLVAYGYWAWHPPTLAFAGTIFALWCLIASWQVYRNLRQMVVGMDYLILSLVVFTVALAISMSKTERFNRWLDGWRVKDLDPPAH